MRNNILFSRCIHPLLRYSKNNDTSRTRNRINSQQSVLIYSSSSQRGAVLLKSRHPQASSVKTTYTALCFRNISTKENAAATKTQPSSSKNKETFSDFISFITTVSIRIAAGISIAHLIDEYGFSLTLCEGPSMMPTINPKGEIILIERATHRLFGLDGGYTSEQRVIQAREKQRLWEREGLRKTNETNEKIWKEPDHENNDTDAKDFLPTWHQSHKDESVSIWTKMKEKMSTGIHVGDVVVVQHPHKDGTVCKRVIGLPGDVIVKSQQEYETFRGRDKLFVVPDGQIWIEGDNTPNSSDSRVYGPVPAALVIGKVMCRIWPMRGNAWIHRGSRPMPPAGQLYTGSMTIPAGYEGEPMKVNTQETDL